MGTCCYLDHPKRLPPADPVIGNEIKGHLYLLEGLLQQQRDLISNRVTPFLRSYISMSPESQCCPWRANAGQ